MIQCMRKYIFEMEEFEMGTSEMNAVNKLLEKIPENELKAAGGALTPEQLAMLKKAGILGAIFAGGVGAGVAGTMLTQHVMGKKSAGTPGNVGGAASPSEGVPPPIPERQLGLMWSKANAYLNDHKAATITDDEMSELTKLLPKNLPLESYNYYFKEKGLPFKYTVEGKKVFLDRI